jgi:glycosyltransferase involved in cell wall biosynthesis
MPAQSNEALVCAVVVARNEESTAPICLAAARRGLDAVGGGEILLVDSASTDRTADIALEHGCRVLAVKKASRICPSAMRFLGASRTRSRYILFLDGDCELEPDFLPPAIAMLEENPSLAVVAGGRRDFYRTKSGFVPAPRDYYATTDRSGGIKYGGNALYRRSALETAGSFDPFLRSKEEQDLAQRIQAAGYDIKVLPIPMIRHMTVPRESARRLLRSLQHGFYIGRGQAMRKFIARRGFKAAFHGLGKVFITLGHSALGILCLIAWLLDGKLWPLWAWTALTLAGLLAFSIRSRGLARACYYLMEWLVQGICLILGFLSPLQSARSWRWQGEELLPDNRRLVLPKVLLVAPLPSPPHKGGVEKGVDLLLHTSLADQTRMSLFNTFRPRDAERPLRQRIAYQLRMLRDFRRVLKQQRPDIVHVKTSSGVNFLQNSLYAWMAKRGGFPVALQIHSGRFEAFYAGSSAIVRAWIRHTLRRADRVLVLSRTWANRIRALAPSAKTRVVPNGLSIEEMARLSDGSSRRPGQIFFLGAGREDLNRDKGLHDVLAILPESFRRHPASRWVLAGLVDAEATNAGTSGDARVRCLGTIDSGLKEQLLRESEILVLPSYFENMPNILLEAMAAGMGVVASSVGAIPEMLGEGGGILVNPGDRARLARALDELLSRPSLIRAQGATNQATVARRYTMEMVERSLKNVYREIASGAEYSHEVQDGGSRLDSPLAAAPVERGSRRVAGP